MSIMLYLLLMGGILYYNNVYSHEMLHKTFAEYNGCISYEISYNPLNAYFQCTKYRSQEHTEAEYILDSYNDMLTTSANRIVLLFLVMGGFIMIVFSRNDHSKKNSEKKQRFGHFYPRFRTFYPRFWVFCQRFRDFESAKK